MRLQLVAKRGLDLAIAALALLLLSPVFLAVATAVRCSSPGPILLRQRRIGKDGRPFRMYKFRTMFADSDAAIHQTYVQALVRGEAQANNGTFKLADDPRVTPIGRFLRRTSLDELPQLLNVLRGDMSLVGPRPPLPYEVEMYGPRELRRLAVMPGMTGLWQVSGRSTLSFHQMIELDLAYIARWSVWLDLTIVLRTPLALIRARGAC